MEKDEKKEKSVTIYEINNKKYTVIARCLDNAEHIDKLYDVICKYVSSQIYTSKKEELTL